MAKCRMCGECCRVFYIPLTEKELRSRKFITEFDYEKIKKESFDEINKNGWNLVKRNKNGCVYLKDKKCSIHNSKPKYCKNFWCEDINSNKRMREMIEEHKKKKK